LFGALFGAFFSGFSSSMRSMSVQLSMSFVAFTRAGRRSRSCLAIVLMLCGGVCAQTNQIPPTITVQILPSAPSPQPLGTTISWTATATDSGPGPITYRFELTEAGGSTFSVVQDFSLPNILQWTPNLQEGTYQVRVTARDYRAQTQAVTIASFVVNPLVVNDQPVVIPTAHPLVALFGAPSCPAGSSIHVAFLLRGQPPAKTSYTNFRPCNPTSTMNFYVAGMLPNRLYHMWYEVQTGGTTTPSPAILQFTTGAIPSSATLATNNVLVQPSSQAYVNSGLIFNGFTIFGTGATNAYPEVTDLAGQVLWYFPEYVQVTRLVTGDPVLGTTILLIGDSLGTGTGPNGNVIGYLQQAAVMEIDLAGNVLRQTSSDRVSEQLVAMGTDPIYEFSHEALRLPNGHTLTFGAGQRIFPAGTQGSAGPVDILGVVIVELDTNFQVVWHWNSFDHAGGGTQLDINRPAILGKTCVPNGPSCPAVLLLSPANDWLHANSAQYEPTDGSLVVSLRNQDWVIKIDYGNGQGTQNVLWRLGVGGDFTMNSSIQYPWFSGQHDAEFQYGGETVMSVFDDGNTRLAQYPGQASRGQVLYVNQSTMTAGLILNQQLGVYSVALGSAQLLPNGNYWFDAGWTHPQPSNQESLEITPSGSVAYEIQGSSTSYRSWRMPDLYTLPTFTSVPAMKLSCPASTATHGTTYSSTLLAAGGVAPYTFAVGPGLPAGLSLNVSTGVMSGTPSTPGTFTFRIQAVDILRADKVTKGCSITVN
jgi:arylsulfate sulfotransferase